VGVACDLGYPCAKFRLPRPFGFRVRTDVCDIRQTDTADGRTDDGRRSPLNAPPPTGRGHNKSNRTIKHTRRRGSVQNFTLNNFSKLQKPQPNVACGEDSRRLQIFAIGASIAIHTRQRDTPNTDVCSVGSPVLYTCIHNASLAESYHQ